MRKFYLLCSVVFAMFYTLNANADRILFTENYEDASTVADTKWTSPSLEAGLSIAGDEYGKFLRFSLGQNNGRSAQCTWGHEIYEGVNANNYTVSYEFSITTASNNQYNGNITVFTNPTCEVTNGAMSGTYDSYANLSKNWLFDMYQKARDAEDTNTNPLYVINGDDTDEFSPAVGAWYKVTINVDKTTRVAEYQISDLSGVVVKSGSHTVDAEGSVDAAGICLMSARYQSVTDFDNITVSVPVEGDYANNPVVALTGIMNNERTYTIGFLEGETLFIEGVDGNITSYDYFDCLGSAKYTTSTSGTFTAYTACGSAESEKIVTEVDASIIQVPAAEATIVAVKAGYGKTYTLTVDNTDVPLKPTIFINYTFKNAKGEVLSEYSAEGVTTGTQVELPENGILEIETEAYGYGANNTTVANNIAYKIAATTDFQHMTAEELKEKGFTEIDVLASDATSGENNWTARRRLYFDMIKGKEVGDTVRVYPYDWEEGHGIRRFVRNQSTLDSLSTIQLFNPVYLWCNGTQETANVKINLGIGLINTGCKGDEGTAINYANAPMGIGGYDENAFVVVTKINDYGTSSIHPEIAGTDEAAATAEYNAMSLGTLTEVYKGNETWTLYRIDTAITKVDVYVVDNATGIVDIISGDKVNADAPVYDLRGMRVNKASLKKGVYIQDGKKFVVK